MPPQNLHRLLDHAALSYGIEPDFWDIWGNHHEVPPETRQSILNAMGVAADSEASLERSLAERARRRWSRLIPPALVVGESEFIEVPISVPADRLGERASLSVRPENGDESVFDLRLWDLPQLSSAEMDGRTWVRKQIRIPFRLPLGYHELVARVGSDTAAGRYIVTPERAWTEPHLGRGGRAAGISLSLYGVRSARNWGCGDFTDLAAIADWASSALDVSFIGLNPLHAIHNRRPFNTSPYLPNCSFYQNFIYLDVEAIEDFGKSRRAQEWRRSEAAARELEELRSEPFVAYERVAGLKLRLLKTLFATFLREIRAGGTDPRRLHEDPPGARPSPRVRAFREFVRCEGALLENFALYSALDESLHACNPDVWLWTQWPAPYQDPHSAETRAFRERRWRGVMLRQYIQWQIDIQLRRAQQKARDCRRTIGLFHDLALATDRFGSDLWANREFYITGARVGAPPDDFSPKGQDWAFPPPNSERHREDGYRLFAESIRKNCRHGGALRIDHVMRLFRLYWIPENGDAAHGAYVKERWEDYVRVLALESVRNRVMIVGEDLGTVEPEIREHLARFGVLSYRLFYFEKNGAGRFRPAAEYPRQSLVSSTTHDLPTLAGFWTGADLIARRAAGMLDEEGFRRQSESRAREKQLMLDALFDERLMPEQLPRAAAEYPEMTGELHNAVVGFLARTPSQLLAINQEDLTKEMAQQNMPGATWQYPNWGRKMRFTVEQLQSDPEAMGYASMFRHWIESTGRRNHPE
jgi:4-alpha-glucanotransferase